MLKEHISSPWSNAEGQLSTRFALDKKNTFIENTLTLRLIGHIWTFFLLK